jgi:hypothetical protein
LVREVALAGLFMLWGSMLLILFILDLVIIGIFLAVVPSHWLLPYWGASIALSGFGAWLAFRLPDSEGFDVTEERAPGPD